VVKGTPAGVIAIDAGGVVIEKIRVRSDHKYHHEIPVIPAFLESTKTKKGVFVKKVLEGGEGVFEAGDRITKFDGRPVSNQSEVLVLAGVRKADSKVKVTIERAGKELTVEAKILVRKVQGSWPDGVVCVGSAAKVREVTAKGVSTAFGFIGCKGAEIRGCTAIQNMAQGMEIGAGCSVKAIGNTVTLNHGGGIWVMWPDTTAELRINQCVDTGRMGILVGYGAKAKLENNHCGKNDSEGIRIEGAGTSATVDGDTTEFNGKVGISVGLGATVVIRKAVALRNASVGVAVSGKGTEATIQDCVLTATGTGIAIWGGKVTAKGNRSSGGTIGISVSGKGLKPTLTGNTCEKALVGISFDKGAKGKASRNTCRENRIAGILVEGAGTAPFLDRNTCDNNNYGIRFEKGAAGEARKNKGRRNKLGGLSVDPKALKKLKLYKNDFEE
jgi:hypothetical protein